MKREAREALSINAPADALLVTLPPDLHGPGDMPAMLREALPDDTHDSTVKQAVLGLPELKPAQNTSHLTSTLRVCYVGSAEVVG